MALPTSTDSHSFVLNVLDRFPAGATAEEISASLPTRPSTRTVQRWIARLIARGEVLEVEDGLEIRYRRVTQTSDVGAFGATDSPIANDRPATSMDLSVELPGASSGGAGISDRRKLERRPLEAEISQVFYASVPTIIAGLMSERTTIRFLQAQARLRHWDAEGSRALVAFGRERLLEISSDEAEAFGVEPDHYAAWRQSYVDDVTSSAAELSVNDVDVAASTSGNRSTTWTGARPRASAFAAASDRPVPQTAIAPSRVLAKATTVTKAMLATPRLLTSGLWGAICILGARSVPELMIVFSLLALPVLGLPWLVFRWQDVTRSDMRLTGRDAVICLVLGGVAAAICALPFVVAASVFSSVTQ